MTTSDNEWERVVGTTRASEWISVLKQAAKQPTIYYWLFVIAIYSPKIDNKHPSGISLLKQ